MCVQLCLNLSNHLCCLGYVYVYMYVQDGVGDFGASARRYRSYTVPTALIVTARPVSVHSLPASLTSLA